jgi:hypothetical protein
MSMKRLGGRTSALVIPSPPLKFRTSGFPQYGFKRGVARDLRPRTYTRAKPAPQVSVAASGRKARPSMLAFSSRGPWLAIGFCCPGGSSRTMASSEPLAASCPLMNSSTGLCYRRSREGPQFTLRVCPIVPPPGPRRTERSRMAVASPFTVAFTVIAAVRHPRPARSGTSAACHEAESSSHVLRPDGLLALHRPGRLRSSFHLLSRLRETSNMTTRADSQFPRPVFHRRDTQHYGLRTMTTKKNTKKLNEFLVIFLRDLRTFVIFVRSP